MSLDDSKEAQKTLLPSSNLDLQSRYGMPLCHIEILYVWLIAILKLVIEKSEVMTFFLCEL